MKRADDFQVRSAHLKDLTDEQLEQKFWQLAEQIVDPLIELATNNTSPSIERAVLLRMGFSGIEAQAIVKGVIERGLMGKGAGNVVYRVANEKNIDIRKAGLALAEGKYWAEAVEIFKGGDK